MPEAVTVLDGLGVAHDGSKDIGVAKLLDRDPDGIALELFVSNG